MVDFQAGMLSVSRKGQTGGRASQEVMYWPVTEMRLAQAHDDQFSRVQAAPREAWIGSPASGDGTTVVLIRVGFLVDELDCVQPDEWRVETLSH